MSNESSRMYILVCPVNARRGDTEHKLSFRYWSSLRLVHRHRYTIQWKSDCILELYISIVGVTLHVTHISSQWMIFDDSIHIPIPQLPDHSEEELTCHLIKGPDPDICTLWHWMIVLEGTNPQQHGAVWITDSHLPIIRLLVENFQIWVV